MIDNQSGLISNNTSLVSAPLSRNLFGASRAQQPSQFHPDSTDNLVQEILRQRAQRLNGDGLQKQKADKSQQNGQMQQDKSQNVVQNQDSNHQSEYFSKRSNDKNDDNLSKRQQKLNNHSKGSINQQSFQKQLQLKNEHLQIQDNVEVLNNQTNPDFNQIQEQQNHSGQASHQQQTHNGFNLASINNKSEKSAEHSQKSITLQIEQNKKINNDGQFSITENRYQFSKKQIMKKQSSSISKPNTQNNISSQSEIKNQNKSIEAQPKQNESLQQINGPSHIIARSQSNHSKEMRQEIGGTESKIQANHSVIQSPLGNYKQKQGFYDFTPIPNRSEADVDLVKAIAAQLNTIDHEESNNKNIRKSSKHIDEGNESESHHKQSSVNQSKRTIHMQQFETQYSQNIRDAKILQHRHESNIQLQIAQLKEMIMLYQALISDQECKDTRKMIKQLEMSNRREKISLRAGSYSKRFNFHSPITKNNQRPLQFRTKFIVSQRLADKYYGTKKMIADEKLHHVALQQKMQVLNDYYDMMKNKKIKSYQQTLKQYEYNSKLQKYETVKNGFFHKSSLKQTARKSQYQFNKTKRTIQFQESDVPFHQVLKFKIDISKDMILQFQVWSLGKIKKLRDQNILIKKQIQYVDQLIKEVDKKFMQLFGIKSVKSASKDRISSPNTTTKKFSLSNRSSEKSPAGFRKRPITPLDSPQKISLNVSSSSQSNNMLTPNKGKQFKRTTEKIEGNQMLLIESVQLDYSKRKAMRILQQCDDYGMGPIQEESKVIDDIPTFGKKQAQQLVVSLKKSQPRSKNRNLVRPASRSIKTQTSLPKTSGNRLKTKISQQSSPRKALAQSQYYTSMDDVLSKKSK